MKDEEFSQLELDRLADDGCSIAVAEEEGAEEVARLRVMLSAAYDRIASQSDALSRSAEGRAVLLLEKLGRLASLGQYQKVSFLYPSEASPGTMEPVRIGFSRVYRDGDWYVRGTSHLGGSAKRFLVDRIVFPEAR